MFGQLIQKNKLIGAGLGLVAIAVSLILAFYPFLEVKASSQFLSISVSKNIEQAKFGIVVNPDGTYTYQYDKPKTKIKVGGDTSFIPKIQTYKFDDSHWFSLELNGIGLFEPIVSVDGKIEGKAIDKDFSITYAQTGLIPEFNDEGGLDIFITTGKDASNNVLEFTFDSLNIDAYFQPELTQAEIDEGAFRPEHVVNSIAFYCSDQGGVQEAGGIEWKTGKVGHLYRMMAHSYDGKVPDVWCDWSINGDVFSLTIPFDWYNDKKTKFPIIIAPVGDTFGYTSAGGSVHTGAGFGDRVWADLNTYSPASDGTSDSLHAYVSCPYDDSVNMRLGMYIGTDFVDGSSVVINHNSSTPAWKSANVSVSVFSASNYTMAALPDNNAIGLHYDDTDVDRQYAVQDYASDFPDPITWTSLTTDRTYSIYCTYTASASFDISNTPNTENLGILAANTSYYAFGSAPSNPVDPGECTFTITNNAAGACDLDMNMADFTGGVGWNIAGSVGENEVKITAYYEGQNPASGLVLTNSDQEFYDGLAGSATLDWDFKIETGTFTDGVAKSGVLTITAVAED